MSKHGKCDDKKKLDKLNKLNNLRVKELKVKNGCFQSLKALDINAKNVNALSLNTEDFTSVNADITNLKIKNINGRDVNCNDSFNIYSANIIPVEYVNDVPIQPVQSPFNNTGTFYNSIVWDGLWKETLFTLNDVLIPNLACGRFRNKLIYDFYCDPSCLPDDYSGCTGTGYVNIFGDITGDILTVNIVVPSLNEIEIGFTVIGQGIKQNTVITEKLIDNQYRVSIAQNTVPNKKMLLISNCPETKDCSPVPMKIYGQYTIPPGIWNGTCLQTDIASSIVYNLDVINRTINLASRAVSVMVQIGWIDPNSQTPDKFAVRQIDLAIRQFSPSIAAFLGEQMAATNLLPTDLMMQVLKAMPAVNLLNQAAVQLVVFVEDGVEVFVPPIPRAIIGQSNGNVSASFNTSPIQGQFIITSDSTSPFQLPAYTNSVDITITGFGGGGGGGSGVNKGGGGGGGSGDRTTFCILNSTARYISFNIGKGGQSDQNGGETNFLFLDINSKPIPDPFIVSGGKSGKGSNGGDGFYGGGGGGGSKENNFPPGSGGKGSSAFPGSCGGTMSIDSKYSDGLPGNSVNGGNGGGGFDDVGKGGIGLDYSQDNDSTISGGGGGGGSGGGNGAGFGAPTDVHGVPGGDAQKNTGAGGGGGNSITAYSVFAKGGKGADGYILISLNLK
jgi:hypothetical protein